MNRKITAIDLIASSVCNLNCSFCYLNKNKAYKLFDEEIRKAWIDGSYVNNLKKVFDKIQADPNEVKTLSFWGGEPTLGLKYVTPQLKRLLELFPNVDQLFTSTNFLTNIDDIIEFIKEADALCISHSVRFQLQMSIDGPDGPITAAGHTGTQEQYESQMDKFISEFTKLHTRHIMPIVLSVNSTVEFNLYNELFVQDSEMIKFVDYITNFLYTSEEKFKKHCVTQIKTYIVGFRVEYPVSRILHKAQ